MHDPLTMSGRGGVPLNTARPARQNEPAHAKAEFERLGIPVPGTLDAYADGGDRCWIDDTTAVVGLGYRTNRKGAQALRRLLEPEGVRSDLSLKGDGGPTCLTAPLLRGEAGSEPAQLSRA